jgi:cytochrome bd-type quinol oxidase subunit 2
MSNFERFLSDLSSWYWWVSVVVIGLLINLVSSYLKQPLDKWLEKRSVSVANRRSLANATFTSEVALMVKSPGYLASVGFMEVRHRFMTIVFAVVTAVFVRAATNPSRKVLELGEWAVWIQGLMLFIGLASAAFTLWAHKTAANDSSLMFAARHLLRETNVKPIQKQAR